MAAVAPWRTDVVQHAPAAAINSEAVKNIDNENLRFDGLATNVH